MIIKQFFELLQSGLWNRSADVRLFDNTNWQGIFQLAKQQAVMGIVFDGIHTLPITMHPPRPLYLQWCTSVAQIEEANKLLNEVAGELFAYYKNEGLKPILLKGQGVAINYPHPEHRQPGDIDVLIGDAYYTRGNDLLEAYGGNRHPTGTYKHTSFDYRNVEIENHRIAAMLRNPISDRRFRKLAEELPGAALTVKLSGGDEVDIPPPTFNTMYLLVHAVTHFISGGVGLRQICDWARLVYTHKADINREELNTMLRNCHYMRPAKAFATIAIDYLGLPEEYSPVSITNADRKCTAMMLDDILQTGNFGQHDKRVNRRPTGYWRTRFRNYYRSIKRCWQFRSLSPSETTCYAITTAFLWSGVQLNKLKTKVK